MSNIPGLTLENIFLVLVSFVLILLVNRKTNSKSAVLLLAILIFHHVVAYLYAFYLSRPPNEHDPTGFLQLAQECSVQGYCGYFGPHLYATYLAKMLTLGESIYFVFLLNVLFFVISLYYFIGISNILSLKANRKVYIFLYSMWPSVVYFTTLNYREPFELYLLIAGIYFGLSGSKSGSFIRMLTCMILLFFMGIFHMKGLALLSLILFFILMTYRFSYTVFSVMKKAILLMTLSLAIYFAQGMYADFNNEVSNSKNKQVAQVAQVENKSSNNTESPAENVTERVLTGDRLIFEQNKNIWLNNKNYPATEPGYIDKLMRKITFYRAGLTWVTTLGSAFVSNISDKNIAAFIATYLIVYLEYLFSPFIFQVNSFLSLFAYTESILRVLLFASSLLLVKRYPQVRVLFIIYLAITAMWAIGVVSFGASIRHHIQTNWILVLLGVPLISEYMGRKFRIENGRIKRIQVPS